MNEQDVSLTDALRHTPPGRGRRTEKGEERKRNIRRAERQGDYPHRDTAQGQLPVVPVQASNAQGWALPAVSSGLNQAPSLRAQARWGPSNQLSLHPAFIIQLDFLLSQGACAGQGSSLQGALRPRGRESGERCEQRIRAQFEALNRGSLSSHRGGSKPVVGERGSREDGRQC